MKKTNIIKYTKETILGLGVYERNFPKFKAGDTISVTIKVQENNKERLQQFEGVVIRIKGSGIATTFNVRKITEGVSVERIFPYYSPIIEAISLVKRGSVRRAKIYYFRERYGKKSIIERKQDKIVVKKDSIKPISNAAKVEEVAAL